MKISLRMSSLLVASALVTGCAHHREFRVAYVGSEGSAAITGDDGSNMTHRPPLVVAPGSAPLGTFGRLPGTSGGQVVNGRVTSVLPGTGQTLVQLANGASLLLSGTGGTLGQIVSVDVGAGRVVGGPSSLVGVNVAGVSGSSGRLVTVSAGRTTSLLRGNVAGVPTTSATKAVTAVTAPVRSATGAATNILTRPGKTCC